MVEIKSNLLQSDIAVSHIGRVVELNKHSDTIPPIQKSVLCARLYMNRTPHCPLMKLKEPREILMPKSELHLIFFSLHSPLGDGIYA